MAITVRGETFQGYNKPKRTPQHATKSHAVLAKEGAKGPMSAAYWANRVKW
jgi:hypothetical protein